MHRNRLKIACLTVSVQEGITDIQHYLGLVPPPSPRRPVSGYDRLLSAAGNHHAPGNP